MQERLAVVTGINGMIGAHIASQLLEKGWRVRGLVRSSNLPDKPDGIEYVTGVLSNPVILQQLLYGADVVFNCAGEVRDESRMMQVNAEAVKELAEQAAHAGVQVLCQLSSAGVTGSSCQAWVDEETLCRPVGMYEISKWLAENYLHRSNESDMRICIIRPTNVVDSDHQGVLGNSAVSRVDLFLKGNECAHLVHASDVARAAIFVAERKECRGRYLIGLDEDRRNTLLQVVNMARKIRGEPIYHGLVLPAVIPYWLRRMTRGRSLHGRTRFSSDRLRKCGYRLDLSLDKLILLVCESSQAEDS